MTGAIGPNWGGLFWSDAEVLRWKAEKAIAALYAVVGSLSEASSRSNCEGEFLELFHWSETISTDAFDRVAMDPRTYFWARLAFQICAAVRAGADLPPTAQSYKKAIGVETLEKLLEVHLDQYKALVIALAILDRRAVDFTPLQVRLPLAIPATPWSFSGNAELALTGLTPGGLVRAAVNGCATELPLPSRSLQWSPDLAIEVAPAMVPEQQGIFLQPHAFHIPSLEAIASAVSAGVPFQWGSLDTARAALDWMRLYAPTAHSQFLHGMRTIALKPPSVGGASNTSCSRLPGAAVFTAKPDPAALAEDFVHELYHTRLFALEESSDFLLAGEVDPVTDAQFYSPWREDPRPLYGLLHAQYVFERVLQYWLAVLRDGAVAPSTRRHAAARAACLRIQLELATVQLGRHASFTSFGQTLFDALHALVMEGAAQTDALGIDAETAAGPPEGVGDPANDLDGPATAPTVAHALRLHAERFDTFGRRTEVRCDLSPTVQTLFRT